MRVLIYCHTHIESGKRYVGQTRKTMAARWNGHKYDTRHGSILPIHSAIRKYGEDAFAHEILETVSNVEEANAAETRWITNFNSLVPNGYNLKGNGDVHAVHEDTRKKLIAIWANRTQEERQAVPIKMRASFTDDEWAEVCKRRDAARTPEVRSRASKVRESRYAPELRKARASHAAKALLAKQTKEEKAISLAKMLAGITPEIRKSNGAKAAASKSKEQHIMCAKLAWVSRRRRAKEAAENAGQLPMFDEEKAA